MADSKKYNVEKQSAENGVNQMTIGGDTPYAGMSKAELARFSQQPFWIRLRWVLFILFWLIWVLLLIGAIVIIATTPFCSASTEKEWWETSIIYQIYPRSFQDTDGDGNGDINGIRSRLSHLEDLKVGAVWLNPVYKSPQVDNGYDVENYREIDSIYGNMADMEKLIQDLHDKDMKMIMDFIPNHTSDQHRWFQASRANNSADNMYRDYYVWRDGDRNTPPNNWLSVFGGRAWTYDESRRQWYLHQFLPAQPDLNVRNLQVQQELEDIIKFWLDKGVDGFRIDAIKHLFEDESFANEDLSAQSVPSTDYNYLKHSLTVDQQETYDIVKRWSELFHSYSPNKLMITEAYSNISLVMKYFDYGADIPFNFNLLLSLGDDCPNKNILHECIYEAVTTWLANLPQGESSNWVVGNHDQKRVSSRVGEAYVNAINMLLLLLPGTPTVYYGEEIGMKDNTLFSQQTAFDRNYSRTPMQWNASANAGFTTGTPWLPLNNDYTTINVEVQGSDINSTLSMFKNIAKLRSMKAFTDGETRVSKNSTNILAFTRQIDGESEGFLIILNFGPGVGKYNTTELIGDLSGDVVLKTPKVAAAISGHIVVNSVPLEPGDGLVVKYIK